MNQVKSTHCTIDYLGSVKYAELVDPMEVMEIANSPVPIAAVSYQKFVFFFNRDTTCGSYYSKNHFCGTDYVCYNEISLQ